MPTQFPKPEYPKILTSKDWNKNKGVIAKMHGPTGIGDALDDLEGLYKAVDWDVLNMYAKRMDWKTVTKASWDKVYQDAAAEVNGNLAKLSKEMYKVRDLCQKVAGEFKKKKTIPSSSTKHVEEMASTADRLGVAWNKNSMSSILKAMYDEYLEHLDKNFIQVFYSGLGKVLAKHKGTVAEIRNNPTKSNFENIGCGKMCRDFTTGLGNIAKVTTKGFAGKGGAAAEKLFEAITPYGDLKVKVKSETEEEIAKEVLAHCDKLDKIYTAVERFYATVS